MSVTATSGRCAPISPGVCFLVTVHEAVTHGRAWQDPLRAPPSRASPTFSLEGQQATQTASGQEAPRDGRGFRAVSAGTQLGRAFLQELQT